MPSPSCSRVLPLDTSLCPLSLSLYCTLTLLFHSHRRLRSTACTAMRPTVHTLSTTNAEGMHRQRRTHHISTTYVLQNGRAAVKMSFVSTVAAAGADLTCPLGRAIVEFGMEQKARLLGAPPQVANPLALVPPYRDTWTEDLAGFVFAAASTRAWRVMLETVYAANRVPMFLRTTLVNRILMEARDSAQAALALAHRVMSVVLEVEVVIDMAFDSQAYQLRRQIMLPPPPVDAPPDDEEDEYEEDEDDAELNDAMMDDCLPEESPEMTEEEIEACMLVAEYYGRGGTDACTICLENLVQGSLAAWLFCGHGFHPDCIKKWLRRNASCPVCRLSLP